jgi:hypothetical protein
LARKSEGSGQLGRPQHCMSNWQGKDSRRLELLWKNIIQIKLQLRSEVGPIMNSGIHITSFLSTAFTTRSMVKVTHSISQMLHVGVSSATWCAHDTI